MSSAEDLLESYFEGIFKNMPPEERLQARVSLLRVMKVLEDAGAMVKLAYGTGRTVEIDGVVHEVQSETSSFTGARGDAKGTVSSWTSPCGMSFGPSTEPAPGVVGGVVTCLHCLGS